MGIKELIATGAAKIGVKKIKSKSPVITDLMDDPESYKIEMFIDNGEIVVKIKKKDES